MNDALLASELLIRSGFFLGVLGCMATWERFAPRRQPAFSSWLRWSSNLGMAALNTVVVRLAFPLVSVGFALLVEQRGWGLLNHLAPPQWLSIGVSLLMLDLVLYLQHVLLHAVPLFWRLHRVHHADLDFDVTTGLRFHPAEMLISMLFKLSAVAALGAPAVAVLIFEVLLNATSMFNHANVRLPVRVDRWLRWVLVTPDMHRVHHSILTVETNSNFGFSLPWWDRLFGTYRAQPLEGHETMTVGIDDFRTRRDLRLDQMLIQPWRGDAGTFPFNFRGREK